MDTGPLYTLINLMCVVPPDKITLTRLPCICPSVSQGHRVPSDSQERCVCSVHTSYATPPSLHGTGVRGQW